MELRIKEIIKEKKVTATSLAEQLGIAQPSMSNIINGKSMPSVETLERISEILEVAFSDLFEAPTNDSIQCPHCGGKIKIGKE